MRRPCQRLPAEWWESEDDGARLALALCSTCPGLQGCGTGREWGVVRAGVAWGDDGKPAPMCPCGYPNTHKKGGTGPSNPLCHRCKVPVLRRWGGRQAYWRQYHIKRKAAA